MSAPDVDLMALTDEQIAPFSKPDEADVRLVRQELEKHKRKLNEASPTRPYDGRGADL